MKDDLWERISRLEEELLAEDPDEESDEYEEDLDEEYDDGIDEELRPGRNYAVDFGRAIYEDEDYEEPDYAPPVKKKGIKGLVFLACLELIGILAIIGWWLQWLI